MKIRALTGSLALVLMALTASANANNVVADIEQGLTPVQASLKALGEGVEAVQIAEALLATGLPIDSVVATLASIGLSNEEILAVLASLPPTAAADDDNEANGTGWGQPLDGNGHPCNNQGAGTGVGCASPS